jgi:hypothetical protein
MWGEIFNFLLPEIRDCILIVELFFEEIELKTNHFTIAMAWVYILRAIFGENSN